MYGDECGENWLCGYWALKGENDFRTLGENNILQS